MEEEANLLKKILAALLIVTLILGTFLSMAMASATSAVLSANDGEDEYEPEEGNDVIGDEESNGDYEEGAGEQENSKESGAKEAEEAIREAEEQVQKASDKIEEVKARVGIEAVTDAENILAQANDKLSQAKTTYEEGKYEEAEDLAEEAKHLAERAKHLAEEALGKAEGTEHSSEEEDEEEEVADEEEEEGEELEEEAEDAMEAIREAEEEIQKASEKIEEVRETVDVTDVESLLDEANNTLSQAKAAYEGGNYEEAEQLAEEAEDLAERAKHLAKEVLGKAEEAEYSKEERDEEEDDELEVFEEEDGPSYIRIESEDSRIRLKMEKPKIRFEYYVNNETEVEVCARFRSLIEFIDLNNDGKIQDDEVLRELDLRDISWNFTYKEITEGDNTLIKAVYYANSTTYEITIIARIYQRAVTESDTTGDRTLVYDVDGGADEAKLDIIITRWTWISDQSQLAVLMKTEAKVEVEGAIAWNEESAGIDEEQITLGVDDVEIKITWVTKAKIEWPGGGETFENVTVAYESWKAEHKWEEDGEEEVGVDLKVYFIYPNFGDGKLIHDPSIGIEDDPILYVFTLITPELLMGTGITAIAIVAAAVALTRRRKLSPLESAVLTP